MGDVKTRQWVLGTAFVAIVLLVATWLLAVSPRLSQAQQTRVATQDELARREVLSAQLTTLREQFEGLDGYRAELAALQVQVPPTAELPGFIREVERVAGQHGVTLVAINPGVPAPVAPAPVAPAAAPAAEPVAEDGSAERAVEGAVPAPAPAPAPAPSRLVSVPISLVVAGTYAGVTSFLESLQTGTSRLYLLNSFSVNALAAGDAVNGRPATTAGDIEVNLDGVVHVLPEQASPAGTEPTEPTEPLPLPTTDRNVFVPVAGG